MLILNTEPGGGPDSFANDLITNHAAACKAASKPCVLEEYGTTYNCTAVQVPWQETCLSAKDAGLGSDMFWEFGTYLASGEPTANPVNNFEIFYNTSDFKFLVTDHVAAIGQG
jgi:mannan endo-1,4-beta-mannosidase